MQQEPTRLCNHKVFPPTATRTPRLLRRELCHKVTVAPRVRGPRSNSTWSDAAFGAARLVLNQNDVTAEASIGENGSKMRLFNFQEQQSESLISQHSVRGAWHGWMQSQEQSLEFGHGLRQMSSRSSQPHLLIRASLLICCCPRARRWETTLTGRDGNRKSR